MRIILVLLLLSVIVSLFTGLYFMYRDKGKSTRVVTALKFRVGLSIITFAFGLLGLFNGWFVNK